MKLLVTGANGFVGRALSLYLGARGHEVVPVVRRACGISRECIVYDDASWTAALKGCECVIHLAARAHVMQDQGRDSLQAYRANNVETTIQLANRAIDAGVRRFVFMSTIKVNGEVTAPGCSFRPENSADPKDPYAISKWEAEQRLIEIGRKTGLEVVIIRPPLIYGPGVKGNFASLIGWVRSGIPLPLGALDNRRSMIALDNLLHFTALCANVDASPNIENQIFLISDGEAISTAELLRRVAKAYRCSSRLIPVPIGLMDLVARWIGKSSLADRLFGSLVIDDSKARQMLGWSPPFTMQEQLQKMAQYDSSI